MLTSDGALYSWGGGPCTSPNGDADGTMRIAHLGHGLLVGLRVPLPKPVSGLENSIIVRECSMGSEHLLFRTASGDVLSCGNGAHGRLGHGDEQSIATPRRINGFTPADQHTGMPVQVCAGECHSMLLTERGVTYSWGSGINGRHGHQLTTGHTRSRHRVPIGAENSVEMQRTMQHVWEPEALSFIVKHATADDADIVTASVGELAAGANHNLAVSSDGDIWSWGSGDAGQLGIGVVGAGYVSFSPLRIPAESIEAGHELTFRHVAVGGSHSLAISTNHQLFSFGFGSHGRLGHGDHASVWVPKLVAALVGTSVRAIAAGDAHSVVVSAKGQVYTFGASGHGKLGHGQTARPAVPERVSAYLRTMRRPGYQRDDRAAEAAVKRDFLSTYAAGEYHDGAAAADDAVIGLAQDTPLMEPKLVASLANETVLEVAAGYESTMVRIACTERPGADESEELRAWGSNEYGQLGLEVDPSLLSTRRNEGQRYAEAVARVDRPSPTKVASVHTAFRLGRRVEGE